MQTLPGTKTIIEIENSLRTKDSAYLLVITDVIDRENITALFVPISINIKLTKRKRYRLLQNNKFMTTTLSKAERDNSFVFIKLCWFNNISKTDIENVFDIKKMQPTQIDVEKHLFEVIGNNYPGEKYV